MDVSLSLRRHALHQEKEKIVVAKLIPKNGLEKMNKSVGSTILYTIYALVKPIERQFLDLLLCKRTLCIEKLNPWSLQSKLCYKLIFHQRLGES